MSTQFAPRKKSKKTKSSAQQLETLTETGPAVEPVPGGDPLESLWEQLGLPAEFREPGRWFRHLRRRARPKSLKKLWGAGKLPPLWWGLRDSFFDHPALADVAARVHGAAREDALRDVVPWNSLVAFELTVQQVDDDLARALRDLDRLQQSPRTPPGEDPAGWWQTIRHALEWPRRSANSETESDWQQQLARVEFPLTLAYLYPEFSALAEDVDDASIQFENLLATRVDLHGLPRPESWPDFRALLASWLRSARLLQALRRKPSRPTWEQLAGCVRQTLRAMRADQNQMLLAPEVARGLRPMLRLAETLPLKRKTRNLVRGWLLGESTLRPRESRQGLCECAEIGGPWILQNRWRRGADKVAVWADANRMQIEIGTKQPLIAGSFWPTLNHRERTVCPIAAPHSSCWYADDDLQLLELQIDYEHDVQLDRLVLLAVQDRVALIADTVHGPAAEDWTYRLQLPLAPGVALDQETETREHYLRVDNSIRALAFPLAVPEWQAERTAHSFGLRSSSHGDSLELTQAHRGTGFHAAVWIDLDPARATQPRTWRQLTVAKDLTPQAADRAVAYRIRSGDEQWLLYRRVDPEMNCYSALGWHFNCELYLGKLLPDHTRKELVRVDWPAVE